MSGWVKPGWVKPGWVRALFRVFVSRVGWLTLVEAGDGTITQLVAADATITLLIGD